MAGHYKTIIANLTQQFHTATAAHQLAEKHWTDTLMALTCPYATLMADVKFADPGQIDDKAVVAGNKQFMTWLDLCLPIWNAETAQTLNPYLQLDGCLADSHWESCPLNPHGVQYFINRLQQYAEYGALEINLVTKLCNDIYTRAATHFAGNAEAMAILEASVMLPAATAVEPTSTIIAYGGDGSSALSVRAAAADTGVSGGGGGGRGDPDAISDDKSNSEAPTKPAAAPQLATAVQKLFDAAKTAAGAKPADAAAALC